ncbi:subtilisin-like protein [Lactarius quietus]|nr:subtilisin-like protein [Lactarius quietus]
MGYICQWHSVFTVLSAGVIFTFATALQPDLGDMRVKYAWSATPANWELLGPPGAETTIDLHIALKSQNENALIDALHQVSTPGHPKYRAHLSKEEVSDLVAPDPSTVALVNSWLGKHGVSSSTVSTTHVGNWLTVNGVSVSQANALLDASYMLYRCSTTNTTALRTMSYAVPKELSEYVKTVAPTTSFDSPRLQQQKLGKHSGAPPTPPGKTAGVLSSRATYTFANTTPSSLKLLYNLRGYVPTETNQNVLALVGNPGESPNQTDLTTFMEQYRPDGASATFALVQVGGPGNSSEGDATILIEYTAAIAYPTPQIFYSIPPEQDSSFLMWLNNMLHQTTVPQTIVGPSLSNENEITQDYATELCYLFAQLGVRGATVIFAAGNGGLQDCSPNTNGTGTAQFIPTFPANCPFVTSVGGTMDENPEVAAPYSSGGFSNYFAQPTYQASAISQYLNTLGNQNAGLYNASGRAFPDISSASYNFLNVHNGQADVAFGTDSAASVAAALISLLNDYTLSLGQPPLGFINPLLYNEGLVGINDISTGSNDGCNMNNAGPGFPAVTGWDAATGLGTLNFGLLQNVIKKLDTSLVVRSCAAPPRCT